ncbi:hypothetical protein ACIBH1_17480 [Nonomuraea sp. NPDC050663]|uniref:hypothetical protein n=1 Tax=Nonomuraea sp. NPDC050663 TaxID=3364370 RepID=UPI0037B404BC
MLRRHLGLVVAGLYLLACAAAAVISMLDGRLRALWLAVAWDTPYSFAAIVYPPPASPGVQVAGLALLCLLKAWMLWQVLLPGPGAAPPRLLRRLLYIAAALHAAGWLLLDQLPEYVSAGVYLLVWGPLVILFSRIAAGWLRTVLLVLAVLDIVSRVENLADEIPGLESPAVLGLTRVAFVVWSLLILLAQRRDDCFSVTTLRIGGLSFVIGLIAPIAAGALDLKLIGHHLDVFFAVWLVRSAHDLGRTSLPTSPLLWPRRLLMSTGAVLLALGLLKPESASLQTFTGREIDCMAWTLEHRGDSDTAPEDREQAFLCPK